MKLLSRPMHHAARTRVAFRSMVAAIGGELGSRWTDNGGQRRTTDNSHGMCRHIWPRWPSGIGSYASMLRMMGWAESRWYQMCPRCDPDRCFCFQCELQRSSNDKPEMDFGLQLMEDRAWKLDALCGCRTPHFENDFIQKACVNRKNAGRTRHRLCSRLLTAVNASLWTLWGEHMWSPEVLIHVDSASHSHVNYNAWCSCDLQLCWWVCGQIPSISQIKCTETFQQDSSVSNAGSSTERWNFVSLKVRTRIGP